MAKLELPGKTLGEKHRHYNELVNQAINANKELQAGDVNIEDNDINNLIKIDVAGKKRDVEYILKVLQCEDMLYVSRAIKKSLWLITDPQHSHIINPHYLHKQLFPQMTSKACCKLMLHIRLHLTDENRVEEFYNFIKDKDLKTALKWLPRCSIPFIENEIDKHQEDVNIHLLKRLCERSITILKVYIKNCEYYKKDKLENTMFLLNTHPGEFLDIVENLEPYQFPRFRSNATSILMKTCPQRIIDKFEKYSGKIDLPTFAKHLKSEELKGFIAQISEKKEMKSWFKFENLKHFVRYLPKEGRFDFLKQHFIEKSKKECEDISEDDAVPLESALCGLCCSGNTPVRSSANIYRWYRFAPFDVAFADLAKLIRAESAPAERIAMFGVLLTCAGRNVQHMQTVLQYYCDKHINEPFKFKVQFVNMLLSKTASYKFNETAWNTLNNIFHSMEVYIESENSVPYCVEAIIVHKLLHNESVPEIIEKKFRFQSMKSVQTKLDEEEKGKVFNYLYKILESKIKKKNINNENEFTEAVTLMEDLQSLLTDWKKNLVDYPWFLEKVQELVKFKNKKGWKIDLSTLYLKNKSWRREMFKESLLLYPSDKTCYNALKHDPQLISVYKGIVEDLRRDDSVSLRRVLNSLRVYWPQSLASEWLEYYLTRLEKPGGHKAVIRGLFTLAHQQQVINIVKKYAPAEAKINWSEDDELVLSLRKNLARNMYVSRPLPPPELVLLYAKGDYLQFTLPSLNAILHNMSAVKTREHLSKLLDAPVSLQKHGIRFAFTKLESEELKKVFHEIWKTAKNPSIRAVLFKQTYDLLCRQTKPTVIEDIWELLSIFIDNLTTDENKIIYDTISNVDKVPLLVKGKFLVKSFKFLKSLPPKANCESAINDLMYKIKDLIEYLDPEFVAEVLLESLDKKFTTEIYQHTDLMASYLLCSKNAEIQSERYKKIVLPILERSFGLWDVKHNGCYCASRNVVDLLKNLSKYAQKFVLEKRMAFPTKLFSEIQELLEKSLSVEKHYQTVTTWKLITTYWKTLEEHKDALSAITNDENTKKSATYYYYDPKDEKKWNEFYVRGLPKFSEKCLQYLKEDIKNFYPSIYWLYSKCLENAFSDVNQLVFFDCLKSLLQDEPFIPSYLVVLKSIPRNFYDGEDAENKIKEIRGKLFSNPSAEIKLHYYQRFFRHDDV